MMNYDECLGGTGNQNWPTWSRIGLLMREQFAFCSSRETESCGSFRRHDQMEEYQHRWVFTFMR